MNLPALQIRTPEGIEFSQQLAGPLTRFLAWVLDVACIAALLMLAGTLFAAFQVLSPNLVTAVLTLLYFVISIGYGILFEWVWRGQTIGKRIFRLRVVDADGLKLEFNQIVVRNLLRFVDSLPLAYLVGGLASWLSPRCQRLGDLAANTMVIRLPRLVEPDLEQLLAGKFNSLRQHPHLAARLRQQVSPAEAAMALQALLRRNEMAPPARLVLFSELAGHFRERVPFPPEATDGIADEQYVRNVVDVLYRTREAKQKPVPSA
jgi:uncharacterized RDD family membrane protein YckC